MSGENRTRRSIRSDSSTFMDFAGLVPKISKNVSCSSVSASSGLVRTEFQERPEKSLTQDPQNAGLPCFRARCALQGFSERAIDIMCASWTKGSTNQYQYYLKRWFNFCFREEINPVSAASKEVLQFLTFLFDNGEGYSAINTARSALSTIIEDTHGVPIGRATAVRRFMKGVFKLRPTLPRYNYIWDVNIVLDYLKFFYPNEDLPLSHLTLKLTMLLALTTAQRVQTLKVLNISDFQIYGDLVIIPIKEILKQMTASNNKLTLKLKVFEEEPSLCVVKCLKCYLDRTKGLRSSGNLLISYLKPYKAVSKQTISRWIKKVMYEAGIDTNVFKSHSTRAAACSKLKNDSVPVEEILKTAGWSNDNCFRKFYDKPIMISC